MSGLIIYLFGYYFRLGAFITAGSNFHHLVQSTHKKNHRLVKNGVYSLSRHPSYLGWFLYNIAG